VLLTLLVMISLTAACAKTVRVTAPSQTSTTACSNLTVLSRWSVARLAAEVIVAPDLDFEMSTVQVARKAGVGGILFLGNAVAPSDLATQLQFALGQTGPGTTPLVMADEEGGGVQRLAGPVPSLPWARTVAATMSPVQAQALAAGVGHEMQRLGVDVDLAPVLDLDAGPGPSATDADGARSFSADPSVAARYGVAFMRGLQNAGVVPVLKHFPGLGGASGNTDYGPAETPALATLDSAGLVPFAAAVAAGAPAVMVSNATVPGLTDLPASLSPEVIEGLLRQRLDFQGLVLTDSLSAGAITQAGYDLASAAVAAVEAGSDMVLFGSTLTTAQTLLLSPESVETSISEIAGAIVSATRSGALPVSRLDNAVAHILAAGHTDLCAQ
jgi:beta-N-acetylhexosaminidase